MRPIGNLKVMAERAIDMDGKLRLDQVFYGYGQSGYGMLASSFADEALSWSVVNACLAIGQAAGASLPAPILLSKITGDRIVMARICSGSKDPSGRNTLFVHALSGSVQDVRKAGVTTFTLADAGVFRDSVPGPSVDAIEVAATPTPTAMSSESLELPAAIETSGPDEKLIRRIVAGRENELSWSTFAFEDMLGYDVICVSKLAPISPCRSIYGQDLRLLRKRQGNASTRPKPASADVATIPARPSPSSRDSSLSVGAGRKNKAVIALLVSIVLNIVLAAVVWRMVANKTDDAHGDQELVRAAKAMFTDEKRVTKAMLENLDKDSPLGGLYHKQEDSKKRYPAQVDLLGKLLAYRDFVEEQLLKRKKEK